MNRPNHKLTMNRAATLLVAGLCSAIAMGDTGRDYRVGTAVVHYNQIDTLLGGCTYEYLYLSGLHDVEGYVTLYDASIDVDRQIRSISGGSFVYSGPKADLVGRNFRITDFYRSGFGGYSEIKVLTPYLLPPMLGGGTTVITFGQSFNGALEPKKARASIPGIFKRGAFTIQNAYFELDPDAWRFGGGGEFSIASLGKSFNGTMTFQPGVGPLGSPSDVTRIDFVNQKGIPIGNTGATLDIIDASISHVGGLSEAANWAEATLAGTFQITTCTTFNFYGQNIPIGTVTGRGTIDVNTGAIVMSGGTGTMMMYFDLAEVKASFPMFDGTPFLHAEGKASSLLYNGTMEFAQLSDGSFFGRMRNGKLSIPAGTKLIGGEKSDIDITEFTGSIIDGKGKVKFTHPEDCATPCGHIPPCIPIPICTKEKFVFYPPFVLCDRWGTIEKCGTWVCGPEICMPAGYHYVKHNFRFDAERREFTFSDIRDQRDDLRKRLLTHTDLDPQGVLHSSESADLDFPSNWQLTSGTLLPTANPDEPPMAEYSFEIAQPEAGVVFRAGYTHPSVTGVDMTVTTPEGLSLSAGQGLLPGGYTTCAGYSRFNPGASEQVIVLVRPPAGTYRVKVNNIADLGTVSVQGLLEDAPPLCGSVAIVALSDDGQYRVSCLEPKSPTSAIAAVYLVSIDGTQSTEIATLDPLTQTQSVLLDTNGLNLPAGNYRVTLAMIDEAQHVEYATSQNVIVIGSAGRPEPVTGIRYLAGDGSFRIQWNASSTADIIGYVVQYVVDLGSPEFDQEYFVAADGNPVQQAEIVGLENGTALLARVLTIGQDARRSGGSEVIRVTPMPIGITRMPRILSTPRPYATAALNYVYVPVLVGPTDEDFYSWTLEQGPSGMTICADTGVLQWTPTSEQTGPHQVMTIITMQSAEGLVSATQQFSIEVVPTTDLSGVAEHAYHWLSAPVTDVSAGTPYLYRPVIIGPDSNIRYDLQIGPQDMTVDPSSGLLTWFTSDAAKSQWVRLRAIVDGQHQMSQDYYLFVHHDDQALSPAQNGTPPDLPLCGAGLTPWMGLTCLSFLSLKRIRRNPVFQQTRREPPPR